MTQLPLCSIRSEVNTFQSRRKFWSHFFYYRRLYRQLRVSCTSRYRYLLLDNQPSCDEGKSRSPFTWWQLNCTSGARWHLLSEIGSLSMNLYSILWLKLVVVSSWHFFGKWNDILSHWPMLFVLNVISTRFILRKCHSKEAAVSSTWELHDVNGFAE